MMKSMDAGIGRVLKALERAKLERDTLVIFTSDNGGERYSYNWPFSFQKMYLHEGGTRVPAIVRWPGVIPAGRVTDAGGDHHGLDGDDPRRHRNAAPIPSYPLDGENLMPVCTGARAPTIARCSGARSTRAAARVGQLEVPGGPGRRVPVRSGGRSGRERRPPPQSKPARFERIKQQYLAWNARMLPRPATSSLQ